MPLRGRVGRFASGEGFRTGTSAGSFRSFDAEPSLNPNLRTKPSVKASIMSEASSASGTVRVVDYQPGNGTRYVVLFSMLKRNDSDDLFRCSLPEGGLSLLGLPESGDDARFVQVTLFGGLGRSMIVGASPIIHWHYVYEKLGVSELDAVVLAELIGFVCQLECVSCEQYEAERDELRKES